MSTSILEEIILLENERAYLRAKLYTHDTRGFIDRVSGRIVDITIKLAELWPLRRMEMSGASNKPREKQSNPRYKNLKYKHDKS